MSIARRWSFPLLLALAVLALPVWGRSGTRWLVLTGEHLLVGVRSDLPDAYLQGMDTPDEVLAALRAEAKALETRFTQVERFLRARYDVAEHGRVPVLVYPSLAAYQRAARCLICAAHVGRPLWPLGEEEPTLSFGAHLNLESAPGTAVHEFVHIVDFAAVPNQAVPLWYEGLASYAADRMSPESGPARLRMIRQYLKRYRQDHPLRLTDYLTRPGYGRWTYNLGTHLIDLLVRRGGVDRFMAFYRALNRPQLEDYDALLRAHYGLTLSELEAEWQRALEATPLTEEGRQAYRFKLDQIVVRWVYLRPLLRDPQRLNRAYRSLWRGGRFNAEEARFMREYLGEFANMRPAEGAVEALLQNAEQLRGYVATYAEDSARQGAVRDALAGLEAVCRGGSPRACAFAYFRMIHEFVRWD